MSSHPIDIDDDIGATTESPNDREAPPDANLWFVPGPPEEEPDFLPPPLPRAEPAERDQIADWEKAQAGQAAHLARVSARLGALNERLRWGPEGWRYRRALIDASELSWLTGGRVSADRLGLWQALCGRGASDDVAALQRVAWAFRRLSGGPGPEPDLAGFLERQEVDGAEPLSDKIAAWDTVMAATGSLHPILRACFAFHLWPLTGIGAGGDMLEGAVVAARLAAEDGQGGAVFVPLTMGGAGGGARRG